MRIEREYEIRGDESKLVALTIEETETRYCENAECEATHDDPTKLWDTRSWRTLCEVYGRPQAERIVKALKQADELGL